MPDMPQSALTRTISHERNQDWPDSVEIVATFNKKSTDGKIVSTKVRSIPITKDQYFGLGEHGAPMSGEWLVAAIDRLRVTK